MWGSRYLYSDDVFADEPEVPGILTCEAMAAHPQPEEAVGGGQ